MRWTYLDRRWPDVPLFQELAKDWSADQSRMLLELLWRAYDLLREEWHVVRPLDDDEDKERTLNFLFAAKVQRCMSGEEPFWFAPQPPETSRRKRGKGMSPTPDHGFVLHENPRSIWPVECKVLKDEHDLRPYVTEITRNFLTSRYGAYSVEGAMVGYLLSGDSAAVFTAVAHQLKVPLDVHPTLRNRPHRVSIHVRATAKRQSSIDTFRCHHLMLVVATD